MCPRKWIQRTIIVNIKPPTHTHTQCTPLNLCFIITKMFKNVQRSVLEDEKCTSGEQTHTHTQKKEEANWLGQKGTKANGSRIRKIFILQSMSMCALVAFCFGSRLFIWLAVWILIN